MKIFLWTLILIIFGLSGQVFSRHGDRIFVFKNVNVIPMDQERILPNQTVVIRNGIIVEIGEKINIPQPAQIIDGKGKYLMPGLIDSHVHLYSTTEMPLYLANGVTTVFDLNGSPSTLNWKNQVLRGELVFAPTIFATGPKFDVVRTPDEAVKEVESQRQAGYDGIKIYPQVSKEEFPALIAAAKKEKMIIVGHIARRVGLEMTLQQGQSLAHAEEYLYTYFNFSKSDNLFDDDIKLDESRIPSAVEMTRFSGVSVVATLVTYDHIVQQATDLDNYLKRPEFKFLAPSLMEKLLSSNNVYYKGFSTEEKKTLPANLVFQKKLVAALQKAGVPIVAGTDSLGVGPVAGFSLHEELGNFVSIGFTPFEALQTATSNAAAFLHSSEKVGTVSVGKRADLLLLDGNPLKDIDNAAKIIGVMVRGNWFPKVKLLQKLQNLPADYVSEEKRLISELKKNPAVAISSLESNYPVGTSSSTILKNLIIKESAASFRQVLRKIQSINPNSKLISEKVINSLGYSLLAQSNFKKAIEVFQINIELYPNSANAYDSLGDAFEKQGNKDEAIKAYEKALQINPNFPSAVEGLRRLKGN